MAGYTDLSKSKSIKEVIGLIEANVYLQVSKVDVAIPYMVGAPGGGKTASIKDMCIRNNWELLSTHFALKPLEETGGIPQFNKIMVNGEEQLGTIWSFPDIFGKLYDLSKKGNLVIWNLDDSHLLGPVHQAQMYELLTERSLRGYHLPENVGITLAGNHASNRAGAKTTFSAIINRVVVMPVYTAFKDWKFGYAINNNVHPAIISFLENDINSHFFHAEEQVDTPWCSPRSWTRYSNMITNLEAWNNNKPLDIDNILYLAEGHVGSDAASSFSNYYSIFTKFNIPSILQMSKTYSIPSDAVDRYALAYALISHYIASKNREQITSQVSEIIYKYFKEYQDLGLMIFQEICDIEKSLKKKENLYFPIYTKLEELEPGLTDTWINYVTGKNV